jgi:hypothetical protein
MGLCLHAPSPFASGDRKCSFSSSKDIVVRNGATEPVQEVALTVIPSVNILLYLGIALIAILFGVLLFLAKRMNLKRKESSRRFGAMNAKVTDMSS